MKKTFIFITALIGFLDILNAQIPNGGFESWTNEGSYMTPEGWDNLNAMTSSKSIFTCMRGAPGAAGSYYLQLVSQTISGMGVMPGIAVCGKLNTSTMKAASGFAYNQRPQSLTGEWQYMADMGDTGFIDIFLTKWNTATNSRDTIAKVNDNLAGMAMNWTNFSINLKYVSGAYPDSAVIILSASGKKPGNYSYLYIDALAFSGTVAGIGPQDLDPEIVNIYPNPVSGNTLFISCSDSKINFTSLKIIDIQGRVVQFEKHFSVNANSINIQNLPLGQYMLLLINNEGIARKTFMKL